MCGWRDAVGLTGNDACGAGWQGDARGVRTDRAHPAGGRMTTVAPRPVQTRPWPVRRPVRGSWLARTIRTTDAKQIGIMYMVTAFGFFMVGGLMALLMRAELARPGMQFLSPEQYNQL